MDNYVELRTEDSLNFSLSNGQLTCSSQAALDKFSIDEGKYIGTNDGTIWSSQNTRAKEGNYPFSLHLQFYSSFWQLGQNTNTIKQNLVKCLVFFL